MTSTPIADLAEVLTIAEGLVAAVREDQWDAPTPCTEWDVRDLVTHLVSGNRGFAAMLRGEQPPPAQAAGELGAQPVAAYRGAADALLEAFRRPGVLEQEFTVPAGSVPGVVALHLRITEVLVHGWDLARATGQPVRFPEHIAAAELEFTRGALAGIPATQRPFAPPQPVAAGAPAIDRLAACLGRSVTPATG